MIRGHRGNPLNPLRWEGKATSIVPTNTRWVSTVWKLLPRRDAWAISTPWFVIVITTDARRFNPYQGEQ
jgi:hypothetical protein